MTTGCCEPRQAGSQDTRVETERRSGTVTAACSAITSAHPVYGGIRSTADGRASPARRQDRHNSRFGYGHAQRRQDRGEDRQTATRSQPHRQPGEGEDPRVSTYTSSPCPTPPRTRRPRRRYWRTLCSAVSAVRVSRRPTYSGPLLRRASGLFALPRPSSVFSRSDYRRRQRHSRRDPPPLRPSPHSSIPAGWQLRPAPARPRPVPAPRAPAPPPRRAILSSRGGACSSRARCRSPSSALAVDQPPGPAQSGARRRCAAADARTCSPDTSASPRSASSAIASLTASGGI